MRHSKLIFVMALGLVGLLVNFKASAGQIEILTDDARVRADATPIVQQVERLRLPDSLVADQLSSRLIEQAYLDVTVRREGPRWLVSPGEPISGRFLILSDAIVDTTRMDVLLTRSNVEQVVDRILERSHAEGKYWAHLKTDSIVRDGWAADLYATLIPGPAVRIGQIRPLGLTHSDPQLVGRMIGRWTGELLTERAVRQVSEAARGIDWVRLDSPAEISPNPGYQTADLELRFSEMRRLSLWGGFGYQSLDNTGMVWQLTADIRSLFGRGRIVRLDSERRDRGNQRLEIKYAQPISWPSVGKFSVDLATRDYEQQFSEFSLQSGLELKLNQTTRWGGRVGFKRVEPVSQTAGQSLYSVRLSLERDDLSERFNPESGYRFALSLDYVYRRYSDDSLAIKPERIVFNDTRVAIFAARYTPIGGQLVMAATAAYEGVESEEDNLPLSEAVLVGGNGTVRGYRNDRFAARRAGLFTIEPRFRFRAGYLFLFYDAAWMGIDRSTSEGYTLDTQYEHGYGLGFALEGAHNRVKLALGWQPELGIDQPRLMVELGADL